jgi:hypothetical protein
MKASIVVAALALGAAAAHSPAFAGGSTMHETRITVGSSEPSPESPSAARHEAAAVLAEARRDCRAEPNREDRQSCMQQAREDYRSLMATARRSG